MTLNDHPLEIAKKVLELEANAIIAVKDKLNEDFEKAVNLILRSKGRLILCGIGKSAHIAQKIVATLNSTGTPSLFLHAAEAVHGDLGMVQQQDVVLMISKSGNTLEIKNVFSFIKATGCPTIAMVGNLNSYLAKNCDYVLDATVDKEACPHNLAPTTSTTVTLALGDALAVTLMKLRNFTADDFAKYHPGGALGKRLAIKVGDVVSQNFVFVNEEDTLKNVIIAITKGKKGCTLVKRSEQVIGIVTDGDIRRAIEKNDDISQLKAKDVMTYCPKSIQAEEFAYDALILMENLKISQLLVYQNSEFLGIVHLHDLLNEGLG